MPKARIYKAIEIKHRTVTGPMMDETVGRALRECGVKDRKLSDVYVVCLDANGGARKRAAELETVHKVKVHVVKAREGVRNDE